MTKRKLIFVIINLLFALKIFAQSEDSFATQKLKPLKKDEVLEWEFNFDEGELYVNRCSSKGKKLYAQIDFIKWRFWDISGDKKKILYCRKWNYYYEETNKKDYYLLDGNTGKIQYLGQLIHGTSSGDLSKILCIDESTNQETKFILYSLEPTLSEQKVIWKTDIDHSFDFESSDVDVYRSDKPEFDYHVFKSFYGYIKAEAYITIKNEKVEFLNIKDNLDKNLDELSFSDYEYGM